MTKHRTTTHYHPQTNGVIEKFHYSLINTMKYLTTTYEKDWDDYIDVSLFVFRSTQNKTLKMSPFEALYGFKASLPCDLAFKLPKKAENIEERLKQLKKMRKEVEKIVEVSHKKMMEKQEDKLKVQFKKNDAVYVKNELIMKGKTKKFSNKYTGPWVVREQTSSNNYKVKHAVTGQNTRVHLSKLKKGYFSNQELEKHIKEVERFEKEEKAIEKLNKNKEKNRKDKGKEKEDEEEPNKEKEKEYDVEEIIDHRDVRDEGRYYLVKWLDYDTSHNTWEHRTRLNCTELLENYLAKERNKEKRKNLKFEKREKTRWDRRGKEE